MRLGWDHAAVNAPELAQRAEAAGRRGHSPWTHPLPVLRRPGRLERGQGGQAGGVDPRDRQRRRDRSARARDALDQSGADAVMIGRGAHGRPWLAGQIDRLLGGRRRFETGTGATPGYRLGLFDDALAFYGERLGLKVFRKHLGWYVEAGPRRPIRSSAAGSRLSSAASNSRRASRAASRPCGPRPADPAGDRLAA